MHCTRPELFGRGDLGEPPFPDQAMQFHHDVGLAVGPLIRARWAIENSLHWVMDMVFRDDECRVRTDNAPGPSPIRPCQSAG
jgi:hypothetical protein